MTKKLPRPSNNNEEVHIEVESWQWNTAPQRFTWKHWLVLVVLISVAILLGFGFLIIAGVALIIGVVVSLVLFLFKKLSGG